MVVDIGPVAVDLWGRWEGLVAEAQVVTVEDSAEAISVVVADLAAAAPATHGKLINLL